MAIGSKSIKNQKMKKKKKKNDKTKSVQMSIIVISGEYGRKWKKIFFSVHV